MKTLQQLGAFHGRGLMWISLWLLFSNVPAFSQASQPSIKNISTLGTNISVEVDVPAGIHRITLESRTRLNAGAWVPVAVKRLEGGTATVNFTIPHSEKLEVLRVRAD